LKVIASDPQLQFRFNLLITIPGIAQTSAIQTLAELAMISSHLDVRQWVAYAGLGRSQEQCLAICFHRIGPPICGVKVSEYLLRP
jgi:transposase